MRARGRSSLALTLAAGAAVLAGAETANAWTMLVANDEKQTWNDAGKPVFSAPGKDTVSVVEIGSDPLAPKIVASLELINTIMGPPTNVLVTPDGKLGLVANSMRWDKDGENWKPVPDNRIHVIDLEASPPVAIGTVEAGDQPSGMAINREGTLALVANRASKSITVLALQGKTVQPVGSVDMGDSVAAIAITPDGRRALAAKFPAHKIAVLEIAGQQVSYKGYDMPVGLWPYNIAITPDGKLALTADNGASGASDGHVDTVSVIDLEAEPPRVIDKVMVGDAPEGLAISPKGDLAVAVLLQGSAAVATNAWFANKAGSVVPLAIQGKKVTPGAPVPVGRLPEGAVFSPDGRHLYIGNYSDRDVSILAVDGQRLSDTGQRLSLPGQPAAMRGPGS
jgi:DNA-binding beta-propeller fold protein YncE